MKRILFALIALTALTLPVHAADLAWDYPAEYDSIDGYTIYFTDGTAQYVKTIAKTDLVVEGATVTYPGIDEKLNLPYGQELVFYITAYNDADESGPSNSVTYTRPGYAPPDDSIPAGITINIPNAPVTINIR